MDKTLPAGYLEVESKIPGIVVFRPAPKLEEARPEVISFNCPQCGATTAYSVEDGGLKCAHCGYYEAPQQAVVGTRAEENEFTVETMAQDEHGWGEERRELECQNCGAKTVIPMDNLTHTCAFCASNKVIQRAADQDVLRPKFLIPFKLTPADCQKVSRQWLGSSWMTPAALSQLANIQAFNGVYLPYWTFDSETDATWKGEVGHTVTERYYDAGSREWRTRTRIDWRWESGKVHLVIDDLVVPGTNRLSALHLGKINDFNLSQLAAYESKFLAGMQALGYDVNLEAAWQAGREEMRERTKKACRGQASTGMIRNFSMNVDFSNESWRYILLPIYLAAYRYESKVFQVLINGQSGTISGQRPVDWEKVWMVALAILAPGVLLSLAGLVTLPLAGLGTIIGGIGLFLLLVGVVIDIIIAFQAHAMDDA